MGIGIYLNEGKQHSDEEKALTDMIDTDTNGGRKPLNPEDAEAAMDLGKGLGLDPIKDHRYGQDAMHWVGGPHLHIGNCNLQKSGDHIPALPR